MTADSGTIALSGHAGTVLVLLGAFYKYGDRTEIFARSLKGTEDTLVVLRREISYALGLRLKPVFDSPPAVVEIFLVDAEGKPLPEVKVNPAGSEAYMDAVGDFVAGHIQHIVDYRHLLTAKFCWCNWARRLSRTILAGLAIEICITGGLFVWGKLLGHDVPNKVLLRTFGPTAGIVLLCLIEWAAMLRSHDTILDIRMRYDSN